MDKTGDITVFIPAYNAETFLLRAMESLRKQTLSPREVIIVDDCSADRTGEKAEDYIRQHGLSCWRVVRHQENGGISRARNTAMKLAVGKYLFNMDADDVLKEGILEKLYGMAESRQADLAVCGYTEVDVHLVPIPTQCQRKRIGETVFSFPEDMKALLKHHYVFATYWGKLYRRSAIEDIWNEPGMSPAEDTLFVGEFLLKRKPVIVMDTSYIGYCYVQNPKSLTHLNSRERNFFWRCFFLEKLSTLADESNCRWILDEYRHFLRWTRRQLSPGENFVSDSHVRRAVTEIMIPMVEKYGNRRQKLFFSLLLKGMRWPVRHFRLFGW